MGRSDDIERGLWVCHICGYKSEDADSKACDLCFRVTCSLHLRPASLYNKKNGLYETVGVCISCAADNAKKQQNL